MDYIIADCTVADVENCTLAGHRDIYISGQKIVRICPAGDRPRGAKIIDGGGRYAVPGLINLHVHLFGTGRPSKILGGGKLQKAVLSFIRTPIGRVVLSRLVSSAAKNELLSGVTTLRAVGDFHGSDIALRDRCNSFKGAAAGLRMYVSGMAITAPGGHGDGTFANSAASPEGLRELTLKQIEAGADIIKICITGGVMDAVKRGEPGEVKMTEEQVKAVCDCAHASGKKVAAHVQSTLGAEIAARCGVDTIEHGAPFTEESLKILKARGGAQVVTLSPAMPCWLLPREFTKLGEDASYNSSVVTRGMLEGAKQSMAAGIPVGLGTDASCPFCTQYNMWREVQWFSIASGISPVQCLKMATLGNAKILGIEDITGSLSEGKSADILLLDNNPCDDLSALRSIHCMFVRGRYIRRPAPSRSGAMERRLDELTEEIKNAKLFD